MELYVRDVFGNPAKTTDMVTWWEDMQSPRHVALTKLKYGVTVSTVFLGIDHSFGRGVPLLYETMIFGGALCDGQQARYETKEQALQGHEHMLAEAMKFQKWHWYALGKLQLWWERLAYKADGLMYRSRQNVRKWLGKLKK